MIRAYRLQTHEMLFDALAQAFRVLGGVPRRGIFDNMRTAIDRIGSGKTRQINARFAAMASHDLFEATFCNPASGWEKGQVEKNVQDARGQIWQAMPPFADLPSLNACSKPVASSAGASLRMASCQAASPPCTLRSSQA